MERPVLTERRVRRENVVTRVFGADREILWTVFQGLLVCPVSLENQEHQEETVYRVLPACLEIKEISVVAA